MRDGIQGKFNMSVRICQSFARKYFGEEERNEDEQGTEYAAFSCDTGVSADDRLSVHWSYCSTQGSRVSMILPCTENSVVVRFPIDLEWPVTFYMVISGLNQLKWDTFALPLPLIAPLNRNWPSLCLATILLLPGV